MPRPPNLCSLALGVLGFGFGTQTLSAIEIAGEILVELDATDFSNGSDFWKQHQPGTGIPGGFVPRGTPTRQIVGGAPAVLFDGDGDYFVGPSTTPSLDAPGARYSVEIWAYQGNVRPQEAIVSWGKRWGPDGTFASFRYGSDFDFGACAHWGSLDLGFSDVPAPGIWHHLAFTYDGKTQKVYVDGKLDSSKHVGSLDADDSLPIRLGAELRGDLEIEGQFTQLSGALSRLRIHHGVLSPEQIAANHRTDRPLFSGATPAHLITQPLHRFSFNLPAGPAPDGTPITDSIGGLVATVQGNGANFSGKGLQLPGGDSGHAPYVDLPNHILSRNESVTLEFWASQTAARPWSRILMIGDTSEGEITQPGGKFVGNEALALFGNVAATSVNRFTRALGDNPNGGPDRDTAEYPSSELGVLFHHVICYDPQLDEWRWYRDGILMEAIPDRDGPSLLNDINVWFGRSEFSSDNNWEGRLEEIRIYNRTLSESEILGNFNSGPELIDPATNPAHLLWHPTTAGTHNFESSTHSHPWGAGRSHPDGIGATATLATALDGDQNVKLHNPVTLTALNIGASNSGGRFSLESGNRGSLTLRSISESIATITQLPGSFGDYLDLPLTLASPTTITNLAQTPLHLEGRIIGDFPLTKTGPGDVILTNDSPQFTGLTRIVQGALVLGDDGSAGSLPNSHFDLSEEGSLIFDRRDDFALSLLSRGAGSVIHRGLGSLTFAEDSSIKHLGPLKILNTSGPLTSLGVIEGPASFEIDSPTTLAGSSVTRIGNRLAVGTTSGTTLTIRDSSVIDFSQNGEIYIGGSGSHPSSLHLEGGAIHCKVLHAGRQPSSSGVIVQTGGTIKTSTGNEESRIGGSVADTADVWGAWLLHGGSAQFDWNLQIGAYGNGLLEIDGGRLDCGGFFSVGRFRDANRNRSFGVVDVISGSLNATSSDRWLLVGEEGIGVLNIRGTGLVNCANALILGAGFEDRPGHGIVNLLPDGTLSVSSISQFSQSHSTGIINLNGGTLAARNTNGAFIHGIDAVYLYPAGITIDTVDADVAIETPILAPHGMGVSSIPVLEGGSGFLAPPLIRISNAEGSNATAVANLVDGSVRSITITNPGTGYVTTPQLEILGDGEGEGLALGSATLSKNSSGKLTKTGPGSLSLNAPCSFTGGIDVVEGTLRIDADLSAATGLVHVANKAAVTGNGTLGGDLNLSGRLISDLSAESPTPLVVRGTLKLSNARLEITTPAGGLHADSYVLATYQSLEDRFSESPSIPKGFTLDYQFNGTNQIALVRRKAP